MNIRYASWLAAYVPRLHRVTSGTCLLFRNNPPYCRDIHVWLHILSWLSVMCEVERKEGCGCNRGVEIVIVGCDRSEIKGSVCGTRLPVRISSILISSTICRSSFKSQPVTKIGLCLNSHWHAIVNTDGSVRSAYRLATPGSLGQDLGRLEGYGLDLWTFWRLWVWPPVRPLHTK
jgi:hypothetical protein